MPASVFHVHTATTPDITNQSYDILPQRDWNNSHQATISLVGSEVLPAFSNQQGGNVSFGLNGNGFVTAAAAAIALAAGSGTGASTATSGTIFLANSNGVSAGLVANSLTFSVALPNQLALAAGTNSTNQGTVSFANSNGVTAGMNTNGVITFTVQPGAAAGIDGIVAGSQTQTAGTLSFVNSNGLSWGLSNGSNITASYTVPTQSVQTQNCVDATIAGNVAGLGALISSGTMTLAGGPNITVSQAGNAISISGNPPQSQQTQNIIQGVSMSGNSVGAAGVITSGTLYLAGGNNVTISQNGNSLTLNAAGAGASAIAGIAGSNGTFASGTVTFGNSNGASFGTQTGNQITISYTVPNVPVVPGAIAGPGGTITSGTALFSNANGVSWTVNGQTIEASVQTAAPGLSAGFNAGGGNTSGNSGLVTGQLYLAGGNNVTISGSTNGGSMSVTFSGPNTAPSVALSAAGSSQNAGTVVLSNSNGVSFGMNGSTITGSVAAQSAQTLGMFAESNTTGQSSSLVIDARSLSIAFQGNAAGGFSNGSVLVSVTQSNQTEGYYAVSNTLVNSSTTFDGRTHSLAFAGGVSGGFSNGSVLISGITQSVQQLGEYAIGNTVGQSSSSTFDARTHSFSFAGAVSGGYSAGALVISGATIGGLTTGGFYAQSNTTGASSSSTLPLTSLNFQGAGAVSVGLSSNSFIISAPGTVALTQFSGGMSTNGNTAGTTGLATAQLVLVGTGGISLSQSINGGSVSLSIGGGAGNLTVFATGNTAANSSGTLNGQSAIINGLGALTVALSNGSLNLSVPNTSAIVGAGNVTVSTAAGNITISGSSPPLSFFQAVPFDNTTAFQIGNGTIGVYPVFQPEAFAATRGDIFISLSQSTSSNSSFGGTISAVIGLYTRNGSTLSLASSGSQSYTFTQTSNNASLSITGYRKLSVPIAVNFPGNQDLWVAVQTITSSANTNWATFSNVGVPNGPASQVALFGQNTNATNQILPGLGFFSATSANLPASMAFSQITGGNNVQQNQAAADFVNVSF